MEILLAFLRLGLTSFGGPIAHLGYFRAEFVERRRWLDEHEFADLVGMCQFLPGPSSSQVGFCIGLSRGGLAGGLAAFAGFTLPSAAAMFVLARHARALGPMHGLQLVAIAVVAHAWLSMARTLTPDLPRAAIAVLAAAIVALAPAGPAQPLAIAAGALVHLVFRPEPASTPKADTPPHRATLACLAVLAVLLTVPSLAPSPPLILFAAFAHAGALVFGGGHVVLPLLQDRVVRPGWVNEPDFLAGYGAAQAMPGPLFTIATYLGAAGRGVPNGLAGAAIATAGIFAPGLLLAAALLPWWQSLRGLAAARAAVAGCNAATVGVLGSAFLHPVLVSAVHGPAGAIAAIALLLLLTARVPPLAIVLVGLAWQVLRNLA